MTREPPYTLFERVVFPWDFDARKHELGADFAEKQINALSNWELLRLISEAFEEMKARDSADFPNLLLPEGAQHLSGD